MARKDPVEEAIRAMAEGRPIPAAKPSPRSRKVLAKVAAERAEKEAAAEAAKNLETGGEIRQRVASVGIMSDALFVARRTYKRFPDFMRAVWRAAITGSPEPTALQYEMAEYMAYGPSRRMILGFRGLAKSYEAAAWLDWRFMQDEESRAKYLSGDGKKLDDFSIFAKSLFSNPNLPFLRTLAPGTSSRDSVLTWDVNGATRQQSSSFTGLTVMGAMQGGRCDIGIGDDCEQKSNSGSDLMRQRLITRIMDLGNMMIPEREQHFLLLGTYQTLASIYDKIVKERGFDVMYFPARVPKEAKDYHGKLAPSIAARSAIKEEVGKPTEIRFSEAQLRVHERESGPLQWQLEWMMSTKHGDRYEHPFPLDRVIVWDSVNPHGAPLKIVPGAAKDHQIEDLACLGVPGDCWYKPAHVDASTMLPYGSICMAIDPAGSGNTDEAAFHVIGAVPGQLHILDFGGFVNGVDPKTLAKLASIAKKWKVREIVYENNLQAWGSLFEQALREAGHLVKIEGIRATENKTTRILTIEPVLYGGQLVIARKALESEYDRGLQSGDPRWQERLLQYQLAMFRRTEKRGGLAFDDRIDALALGISYLHERFLKTSADMAAAQVKQEMEDERFGDWAESVFGDGTREEVQWCRTRP